MTKYKLEKWYPRLDHFSWWVTRDDEHQLELEMILSYYRDFN
jgi:hypothetical protein